MLPTEAIKILPKLKLGDLTDEALTKIAFADMLDFVQFECDEVKEIDLDRAHEFGAKVSVTTRTVGRGKDARQFQRISIGLLYKYRL